MKASHINPNAWLLDLEDIEKDSGRLIKKKRKGETQSISDKHYFKKGNVLYSKLRPYLNKVIVADENGFCTSEILCFDFGKINNRYAQIYLMSPFFVEYAMSDAYGVKMPRLGSKQGNAALIPIPPLNEQERIVSKVNKILTVVDKYSKVQDALDLLNNELKTKLRKSILQEAIQGKLVEQDPNEEPAAKLLERIREEKQELVKQGKMKKSELNDSVIFKGEDNKYYEKIGDKEICINDEIPFEIPSTWCWVRHNEIIEISGGSQPPKSHFEDRPQKDFIRLFQIRDYGEHPVPIYIPLVEASKISQKGDILLARYGGSLGKVFWAEYGAYNVAMAKVIPLCSMKNMSKEYLYLYYHSNLYQSLVKKKSRSAQAGFNKEDLCDLFFPLPPINEQKRIAEKYNELLQLLKQ